MKKKREILGPTPFRAPAFGAPVPNPTFSGLGSHPSGRHPSLPSPPSGSHPSGPHHDTHQIQNWIGKNWFGPNWIGQIGQIRMAKTGLAKVGLFQTTVVTPEKHNPPRSLTTERVDGSEFFIDSGDDGSRDGPEQQPETLFDAFEPLTSGRVQPNIVERRLSMLLHCRWWNMVHKYHAGCLISCKADGTTVGGYAAFPGHFLVPHDGTTAGG